MSKTVVEYMKPVKVCICNNDYEAGQIRAMLEQNNIPCMLKNDDFVSKYQSFGTYGRHVYVDERDVERAVEIIKELHIFPDADDEADNEPADVDDEEVEYNTNARKRKLIIRVCAIVMLLIGVLVLVNDIVGFVSNFI